MKWASHIDSGGDAVPGGYNGYFVSWDDDGTKQGYLDYQIITDRTWDDGKVLIAMVEVFPEFRHQGVATALLQRLREEFPDREIDTGYMTDDGAGWWQKVAGGTWDMSGDVPVWVQPHDELLADALYSWKGDPTSIAIWCQNIRQDPYRVPDSGSGKQMKAWAEVILEELESAPPIPRKLYRGTTERQPDPSLPSGWSELRSVAQTFGTGPVWVLDVGTARGIRIADYISSGRDSEEREWIVMGGDPYLYEPKTAMASTYDPTFPIREILTNPAAMEIAFDNIDLGNPSLTPEDPILLNWHCNIGSDGYADNVWDGRWELNDGHHRVAAAMSRGDLTIPAYLEEFCDDEPYEPPYFDFRTWYYANGYGG